MGSRVVDLPIDSTVRCIRENAIHKHGRPCASRLYGFDTAKVFACSAVILVHINPGTCAADLLSKIGVTFVVPYFILASLRLFAIKARMVDLDTAVAGICDRIAVPYLTWTIIYFVLRNLKHFATGELLEFDLAGVLLFGQGAVHLYFLPLLVCAQGLTASAIGLWRRRSLLRSGCLAVVVLSYLFIGRLLNYTEWIFFPGVLVFLIVFLVLYALAGCVESQPCFGWFALLLFVASQLYVLNYGDVALLGVPVVFLAAGTSFYVLSFFLPKAPGFLFPSSTYGIFLSHVLFLELIEFLLGIMEWQPTEYSLASKVLLAFTIYVFGVLFTLLVRRNLVAAKLLLGEKKIF